MFKRDSVSVASASAFYAVGSSLFVLFLFSVALAQENRAPIETPRERVAPASAGPLVTATATAGRVRFVSPGTVVQLRLEVFNEAGQKLFDTGLHGGNVLDSHLQDGAGERLRAGSYACALTTKSLSGRLSQRVGIVTVNDKEAAVEAAGAAQLSMAQQQAISPVGGSVVGLVEGNVAFTVLEESEAEALTAVTHDGTEGQMTRTRGALSFRLGDFFAGTDLEQMRLTEEGNLGIGTSKPQVKLDVAGMIRAREGLMFSDGSTLKVNEKGVLTRTSADGASPSSITSTQNRIAKFTDNAGTLGDSVITEATSGKLGIGTASPNYEITLFGNDVGLQLISSVTGTTAADGFRFGISSVNDAFLFNQEATDMFFGTSATERMRIKASGNVGIGTSNPTQKLDVAGDINTSTQYRIGGNRVFSIAGTNNTFAGVDAGLANFGQTGSFNTFFGGTAGALNTTGSQNSFFGNFAGRSNTTAGRNSFFGTSAGFSNTTGQGNSFFGTEAGLANTTGGTNSFFGNSAGRQNTTAGGNSFFGHAAGLNNTTGDGNSFFGSFAGSANTTGATNSFFGGSAGFANTTGDGNSFFGRDAGLANTTGVTNSFFGNAAGRSNTTAGGNSFFGHAAGLNNTTGGGNAFFGKDAGFGNTTGGSNAFFGKDAGSDNTTGSSNAFFGNSAGTSNTTGGNNSFFGETAGFNNTTGGSNSFFGVSAGTANTTGDFNSFFGASAGAANTTGDFSSFFGRSAGESNTTGVSNSFFGASAGESTTTGDFNSFFGSSAGALNTTGSSNSFLGRNAGSSNTTGNNNSFFGGRAGNSNTTGDDNSFFGSFAGSANTTGASNSFFGKFAGSSNATGGNNSFFGVSAGDDNTTGGNNSFFGSAAGSNNTTGLGNSFFGSDAGNANTTGDNNIVIGNLAGANLATGNDNIYLANSPAANESNSIRIGTEGVQTRAFIAGISGNTVAAASGTTVFVDAFGRLGTIVSSRRFKQVIRAMGYASSKLMQLRPVTFRYKPEVVEGMQTLQYGLIAEEVEKIYPDLVQYAADGKPQTVRYHLLNTMLLNEVQQQQRQLESQKHQLQAQTQRITNQAQQLQTQTQQMTRQAQQISSLETRLLRLETRASRRQRARNSRK